MRYMSANGMYRNAGYVHVDARLKGHEYAQAGVLKGKDGSVTLKSYFTEVCRIDADGWLSCTGTYSMTTSRHICWFLKEYGQKATYQIAKECYVKHREYNVVSGEWRDAQ